MYIIIFQLLMIPFRGENPQTIHVYPALMALTTVCIKSSLLAFPTALHTYIRTYPNIHTIPPWTTWDPVPPSHAGPTHPENTRAIPRVRLTRLPP